MQKKGINIKKLKLETSFYFIYLFIVNLYLNLNLFLIFVLDGHFFQSTLLSMGKSVDDN